MMNDLKHLALRKRLLVTESELNRQTLTLELSALSQRTAHLERWFSLGWKAWPVVRGAITLGKTFSAKRRHAATGLFARIARSLRLAGALRVMRPGSH